MREGKPGTLRRRFDPRYVVALPRWKLIEQVVAALEAGLVPGSRVEHNVSLPVIGRPDREPRQCDVVVRTGPPHRETTTIVEVQARDSPPDITLLGGWVAKMHEVGAQHLICVSEAGFPASFISDVANRYGPTVRLMTLDELKSPHFPGLQLAGMLRINPKFKVVSAECKIKLDPPLTGVRIDFNSGDAILLVGTDPTPRDLNQLLAQSLNTGTAGIKPDSTGRRTTHEIDIGQLGETVTMLVNGQQHRVLRFVLTVELYEERELVPLHSFAYRTAPETVNGDLAWVATAVGVFNGVEMPVRLVFTPTSGGLNLQAFMDDRGVQVPLCFYPSQGLLDSGVVRPG